MFQYPDFWSHSMPVFSIHFFPSVFISDSIRLSWFKLHRDNLDFSMILAQDSFSSYYGYFHLAIMFSYFDKVKVHCGTSLNKQKLDSHPISRKNGNSTLSDVIKVCWTLNRTLSVNPHLAFTVSLLRVSSMKYLLVRRSVASVRTCCSFYGKPSRNFLISNFNRILRWYLIFLLEPQFSCLWMGIILFPMWG